MNKTTDVPLSMLLIEGDVEARVVFERQLKLQFPKICLQTVDDPEAAMVLLENHNYDIVVCSAFLAFDRKVAVAEKLCSLEEKGTVLLLTAHPDFNKESLPPGICVRAVLHKPLDLGGFMVEIENVAREIETRNRDGAKGGPR